MRTIILLIVVMCGSMAVAQMVPLMQQDMDVMKEHSKDILGRALYLADEATMQTHLMYRVKKKDEEQLARYIREREIRFAPSTDLNFVEKGHLYELYYFDTDWHLLKRVYSQGTSLTFHDVPKNALLLLKDRTGGREERIFNFENGKVRWW